MPNLPKLLVFDLDGCLWEPEMYELYGGSPFSLRPNDGDLTDKSGTHIKMDLTDLLREGETSCTRQNSKTGFLHLLCVI